MDSTVIARWLDRKFPEKPSVVALMSIVCKCQLTLAFRSIFAPDQFPYDVDSDSYKQQLQMLEPFRRALGKVRPRLSLQGAS